MRVPRVASIWCLTPFFARQGLAQYQYCQRFGSLGAHNKFQQQLFSTLEKPIHYKIIRITQRKDIERLYTLIPSYIKYPSLAESVTEVILDSGRWYFPSISPSIMKGQSSSRDPLQCDRVNENIQTYIQGIGLSNKTTVKLMESLKWQAQHLNKEVNNEFSGERNQCKGEKEKGYDQLEMDCARLDEANDALQLYYSHYAQTAIILILSLCKNISTLRMGTSDIHLELFGDFVFKANYDLLPVPQLQKLEHVEILTDGDIKDDDRVYVHLQFLEYFQRFHRLPAMQSISMEGVMDYQTERYQFMPRTSNIRKIHIGHADLPSALLHNIILIPKALEELHVSMGGLWDMDSSYPLVELKEISQALLEHRKTLKVLDLDIDYASDGFKDPKDELEADIGVDYAEIREDVIKYEAEAYGPDYLLLDEESSQIHTQDRDPPGARRYGSTIGSFHDFTAMTHLSIGLKALMGRLEQSYEPPFRLKEDPPSRLIDALPPNLEYLCLYGYFKGQNEDVDSHVEELFSKKAERLPRLKEVKGVDEPVLDLGTIYTVEDKEEDLWRRPEREFDWEKL